MAILNLGDETTINTIWEKGIIVQGYDKNLYRKDFSGAWISRNAYGDRDSILGWEIDHVYPVSLGGNDEEVNLRPINWHNNVSKGDNYPEYVAAVVSDDNKNIFKDTRCIVGQELQNKLSTLYKL